MADEIWGGPPDRIIDEIFVWVGIGANGKEGIISMDMPFGPAGEVRHVPLFSSNRTFAEGRLAKVARQAQRVSMHRADRFVRIELRHFTRAQPAP